MTNSYVTFLLIIYVATLLFGQGCSDIVKGTLFIFSFFIVLWYI